MGKRRFLVSVTTLGLASAALAVGGCSHATYQLREGDCFTASDAMLTKGEDVAEIETTSCTRSHNSEVVGVHKLPDGDYPGAQALVERAQSTCEADFKRYVGVGYEDSEFDLYPLLPTEDTWDIKGARTLSCIALSLPPRTQSVRGAGNSSS